MALTNAFQIVDNQDTYFGEAVNNPMHARQDGSVVISGCGVTADAFSDLTSAVQEDLNVAGGEVFVAGSKVTVSATTIDLSTEYGELTSGQARYIYVYVDENGDVQTLDGTRATDGSHYPPLFSSLADTSVLLARVELTEGKTSVDSNDLKDIRIQAQGNTYVDGSITVKNDFIVGNDLYSSNGATRLAIGTPILNRVAFDFQPILIEDSNTAYSFKSQPTISPTDGSNVNFYNYYSRVDISDGVTQTNVYHMALGDYSEVGTGTTTNIYGLYIFDVNDGDTLNYSIYTNAGLASFGDNLTIRSGANRTIQIGANNGGLAQIDSEWDGTNSSTRLLFSVYDSVASPTMTEVFRINSSYMQMAQNLNLNGKTLYGSLAGATTTRIYASDGEATNRMILHGGDGTGGTGAAIVLYGESYGTSNGNVLIQAANGTNKGEIQTQTNGYIRTKIQGPGDDFVKYWYVEGDVARYWRWIIDGFWSGSPGGTADVLRLASDGGGDAMVIDQSNNFWFYGAVNLQGNNLDNVASIDGGGSRIDIFDTIDINQSGGVDDKLWIRDTQANSTQHYPYIYWEAYNSSNVQRFEGLALDANQNQLETTAFSNGFHVNGTLSKTSGSFKIDHPLDPANMYLQHSFVESPDMMNIYKGRVKTEDNGSYCEAEVSLPNWFHALNGSGMETFEYNLTPIGTNTHVWIDQEIQDGKFVIGSDKPAKVSWVVYAVRHDPFAVENRIKVEVPKTDDRVGTLTYKPKTDQPNYNPDMPHYYEKRKLKETIERKKAEKKAKLKAKKSRISKQ